MAINFDKALGIHPYALQARVQRSEILASNLANVDTPGYLARDYDFKAAMADVESQFKLKLRLFTSTVHGSPVPRALPAFAGR